MLNRFAAIAGGILAVLAGLALLDSAALPALAALALGAYLLRGEMRATFARLDATPRQPVRRVRAPRRADPFAGLYNDAPAEAEPEREGRVYPHARRAARRAGITVEQARVYPTDIGLIGYRAGQAPVVFRSGAVPPDIESIQPYLELYVPMRVHGRLRFELRNARGAPVFAHTVEQDLAHGVNLISPPARLPIDLAAARDGHWELHISANEVPIAVHRIAWASGAAELVRQHMLSDGEISPALSNMLSEAELAPLSIDDLLADQPLQQRRHG